MGNSFPATSSSSDRALGLHLDSDEIGRELGLAPPSASPAAAPHDPDLDQRAKSCVDRLMGIDVSDVDAQDRGKSSVETMGRDLQGRAAHRSRLLKQAVSALASQGADGGSVADALVNLRLKVEELDPNRLDFSSGWFARLAGAIPGIGTPIKLYFSRFESAQTILDAIVTSLERGREQLKRDNLTLQEDQKSMHELTTRLMRQIRLGQLVDQKLQHKLDRELDGDDPQARFIREDILFPLRQRILDLQQQLVVNQQGVLAAAIVMRNNSELIRGVDRALDVTVSALNVAVSTALALGNQRIVLDKVTAINRTTSDLISGTARKLRTQGTLIQSQASTAMIDMTALKSAFADIGSALDEIGRFRQSALPQMAKAILDLDRLSAEGERRVQSMHKAGQSGPEWTLEA